MAATKLTESIILAAIEGFESQKAKLDLQIAELRSMLSGVPTETTADAPEAAPGRRRKFSAASRRKMALAQKKRWEAIKGPSQQETKTTPAAPKKAKRKLSAAARKAIGDAARRRWAREKAAKSSPVKKVKRAAARKTPAPAIAAAA